ncbi:MAG: hypothetical protein ACR2NZ_18300 [Rubripirellula sp.]
MARYATNPTFRFPHHTFADDESRGQVCLIPPAAAQPTEAPKPQDVSDASHLLRDAGVKRIYLVHGTFAGNDIAGIVREVARFSPVSARRLKEFGKSWVDELAGEIGNYTTDYSKLFADLINPEETDPIQVERFGWSGENHHLGRCDGALTLLNQIASKPVDGRILVLAHSHGGNLMAMLSLIVGASSELKREFFEATRMHYHSVLRSKVDLAFWDEVRERLLDPTFQCPPIDVATFGTPLRYRWNQDVCAKTLHFIQHRPSVAEAPNRAVIPQSVQDATTAAGGDYIQHLGVAGTDFLPPIFAWRDWIVERRMGWLFESTARRRDVWKKLKQGRRESADGKTLLIDYPKTDEQLNHKLFGHGVYTCHQWLPFHLKMICQHFYGTVQSQEAEV